MSKLFIFAIGGSGSRVLRSFTMLLASGQKGLKDYDVTPIIIDYDEHNGDTNLANECLYEYNRINKLVWKDTILHNEERIKHGGFFISKLNKLEEHTDSYTIIHRPNSGKTVGESFGYYEMGHENPNSKMLIDALYTNGSRDNNSDIEFPNDLGFKGSQNIGCLFFDQLKNDFPQIRQLLTTINNNDQVVIIGSLFGGSGTAGISEIARLIRHDSPSGHNVPIAAVLLMPYFRPASISSSLVHDEQYNTKTKAAINYLYDSGIIRTFYDGKMELDSLINCAYFIGDPEPTIIPNCDGGVYQRLPAHIVEFTSALSVLHFVNLQKENWACYKFAMTRPIIGIDEKQQLSFKELYDEQNPDSFVRSAFTNLAAFTASMKYFMFEVKNPDRRMMRNLFYSHLQLLSPTNDMNQLIDALSRFWEQFKMWNNELAGNDDEYSLNGHHLSLFNTEGGDNAHIILNPGNTQQPKPVHHNLFGRRRQQFGSIDFDKFTLEMNQSFINSHDCAGEKNHNKEMLLMHCLFMAGHNDHIISSLFNPNN